jgi:Zn-dependent M28 family amino/carboxypeptidase
VDAAAARAWVFDGGPRPEVTAEAAVALSVALATESVAATNVVAVLRGADPALAEEALVYSAHHDHVGSRLDGEVFNGADDNASGSAGVLEIAEAFAASGQRPRRSVLFLLVTGEERGFWGSYWFVGHPPVPLSSIVAAVNLDMIGRNHPDTVYVGGLDVSTLGTVVRSAMSRPGVDLWPVAIGMYGSDHVVFHNRGIPAVMFHTGLHPDYHKVTDEVSVLDADKAARVTRLAFHTGLAVAETAGRPIILSRRGPPLP